MKSSTRIIGIIFLTVFLDMLGVTIVIPVIPALFFDADSLFFSPEFPVDSRSILYGLLVASYPFMQFFGAPVLGTLSDKYGRKPILRISIFGSLIGYILFAVAILEHNLWLLFVSRMIPGFMGGNIAIIMSSISDVSSDEHKARNFGLVGAAFGIGFILGPTIGGILADDQIVSWFNHATPFWFTSILTVINLLFITFAFQETLREKREVSITFLRGIQNIATSMSIPRLRNIFLVVLCLSLGFSFFTQFFSVLLIQKFNYGEKDIGFLYGWIGIWLVFTQAVIVRRLSGKIDSEKILVYTPLALAFFVGMILIPDQSIWFFLINPLIAISQGMTSPNLMTVVSKQAGPAHQGEILGINQSMNSVGQMIPPAVAGWLNTLNGSYPLMAGSLFIFFAWLVYNFIFLPSSKKLKTDA
jgi:DHA1 family tetracycline resistance protein-like MFS transporter